MALVALSQQDEYGLAQTEQDCRGWSVTDGAGTVLGTCTDMIVNTEAEQIDAIVLHTGVRIPAAAIILQSGTVRVGPISGTMDQTRPVVDEAGRDAAGGSRDALTLSVVEERIKVGKRAVASGGVRLTPRVTDQPVEEAVTLRDERVSIERRPMNAPAAIGDLDAFTEAVIEITETGEEVVVAKHARVVEEVVITKAITERQEVVRETVTRTDVDVQPLTADARSALQDPPVTNERSK
jgi:uncharacterized protein (TIGR02271 family)